MEENLQQVVSEDCTQCDADDVVDVLRHDQKAVWRFRQHGRGQWQRQNAGEKMADSDMLTMDWFVEGVIGSVK